MQEVANVLQEREREIGANQTQIRTSNQNMTPLPKDAAQTAQSTVADLLQIPVWAKA